MRTGVSVSPEAKPISKIEASRAAGFRPALALAALGVVFGDIGTSPLYTLKTCFTTAHVQPTLENVLGIVSLLLWALVLVVCVKYVGTLMRVDHDGEGGILALLALSSPTKALGLPVRTGWLTFVVIAGAAMLFGDGFITPAISVISAVEGLSVSTQAAQPFIVPISVGILLGLFLFQSRGTEKVGHVFGPVMVLWFLAIGATGLVAIVHGPSVLAAINPGHAIYFASHHGAFGFLVFGAVVLAITGVEALYADMSHFGRTPIATAWFALVFPALIVNYLGQGAVLLSSAKSFDSPFFALTPGPLLLPMVALATVATVIASQALISGAFTLTEQAINLNLWPRLKIRHTSTSHKGQVYVPAVNIALGIGCTLLVVTFRSSDHLAAAYGLAVSATMLATSLAFYHVVTSVLKWKRAVVIPLITLFLVVDGTFFLSALPKIAQGAWLPLAISFLFVITSWTWLEGRRCVSKSLQELTMPLEEYLEQSRPSAEPPKGTMVFLSGHVRGIPFIGRTHPWMRERADEENVVLLTLMRAPRPYVPESDRVEIERVSERLHIVTAHYGYMEAPAIELVTRACTARGLDLDSDLTSFFYADPKIAADRDHPLPAWQRTYFKFLARNSRPLPDDMGIPAQRRVELGVDVAI